MGSAIPFLGVVFSLVILAITPMAHAQTESKNNQITVNAVVLPVHSVITDEYDQIVKIYSNTAEQATPAYYRYFIDGPNKIEENATLTREYQQLIAKNPGKIGLLYERPVILNLLPPKNTSPALPSAIKTPASPLLITLR